MSNTRLKKPSGLQSLNAFFAEHSRAFVSSLGRIKSSFGSSVMTLCVIGISLALPATFYVMLNNAKQLSGGWEEATQISLYLNINSGAEQGRTLARTLEQRADIQSTKYISKEEGLIFFESQPETANILSGLDNNPLPAVIEVTPVLKAKPQNTEPNSVSTQDGRIDLSQDVQMNLADESLTESNKERALLHLRSELEQLPLVDQAKIDMQWIRKLMAIMELLQHGLLVVACLLCFTVIMVIGNTIRLDIQNRASEIRVLKLIGATHAFIHRPFLYTGFWYGLLGGFIAWLLTNSALGTLKKPIARLAQEYQSDFTLHLLGLEHSILLLLISIFIGLAGSWLAVNRHLKHIEPGQAK